MLTANLRLLPLLLQRFQIADVMMLRPHIHVVRDANGESNWTPFIETIVRTMKPGADNQVSFSEIRIQDGVLAYEDAANHVSEGLDDIDLSLAWPSISRSFAATGQFDWRGERVDGAISASDFVAALSGDRSGLKARIASAPLKLAFDGTVADRTSMMMEGTLTIDSTSLRNALRWTGQAPPGSGGFGRFALKARANVGRRLDRADQCQCRTRRQRRRGRHDLLQQRPPDAAGDARRRRARLHALHLDLPAARQRRARLEPAIVRPQFAVVDRSRHAAVGGQGHGRLDPSSDAPRSAPICAAARWRCRSAEAQMYGGIAKGSFGIARSDAIADVKAELQFTDVDLQACAAELFGVNKLSGRGNINVSLTASGSSPFGLAQSLDGTATLTGHDGAIAGFDAEQLLKRLERRPLSGGGNFRSGSTPYNTLTIAVKFADGIATAEGHPRRRPRRAADPDRHRLGAEPRIRPEGRRQPGLGRRTPRPDSNCRSWCRARGTIP